MDTFTNMIEYYNALEGKLSPLGSETIYQKFIHTTGTVDFSYITLITSNNYLNNLRNGIFAVISIHNIYEETIEATAYDSRITGRTGDGIGFFRPGSTRWQFDWDGAIAGDDDIFILNPTRGDVLYTSIAFINNPLTICRIYLNNELWGSDTDFRDLLETNPNEIYRGATYQTGFRTAIADFGPFFILDLNSVTDVINGDWMESFASTIYNVSMEYKYNVNRIRKAIHAYNNNIKGVYWKSDSISDFTVYAIEDGSVKNNFSGYTTETGCSEVNI